MTAHPPSDYANPIRATLLKHGPLSVLGIFFHDDNRYVARPELAVIEWKRGLGERTIKKDGEWQQTPRNAKNPRPDPSLEVQIKRGTLRLLTASMSYLKLTAGHVVATGEFDINGRKQYTLTKKGKSFIRQKKNNYQ